MEIIVYRNYAKICDDIILAGKRMYDRGFVASNDGNISARVENNLIIITPTGVSKGFIKPAELAFIDMNAQVVYGTARPSSEVYMHIEIYKSRPDVKSISHAHPPYATGYAVAGIPLEKCILPEVVVALGKIPLVDYGTPGTDEFYPSMIRIIKEHDAFLLANHGAVSLDKDVMSAYHRMETIEHYAHILFVANQLGGPVLLNKEQVNKLKDLREKFGINTEASCVSCDEDATCSIVKSTKSNRSILIENVVKDVIQKMNF